MPELIQLASTIDRWRYEVLAYFRTAGVASGPVEAVNGESEAVDRTTLNRGFGDVRGGVPLISTGALRG